MPTAPNNTHDPSKSSKQEVTWDKILEATLSAIKLEESQKVFNLRNSREKIETILKTALIERFGNYPPENKKAQADIAFVINKTLASKGKEANNQYFIEPKDLQNLVTNIINSSSIESSIFDKNTSALTTPTLTKEVDLAPPTPPRDTIVEMGSNFENPYATIANPRERSESIDSIYDIPYQKRTLLSNSIGEDGYTVVGRKVINENPYDTIAHELIDSIDENPNYLLHNKTQPNISNESAQNKVTSYTIETPIEEKPVDPYELYSHVQIRREDEKTIKTTIRPTNRDKHSPIHPKTIAENVTGTADSKTPIKQAQEIRKNLEGLESVAGNVADKRAIFERKQQQSSKPQIRQL
jgi:hypothetical protein